MSNCRRMTHEDVGAPSFFGYKRDGLYSFLDTVFLTGYNELFVLNYTREERVLTVNYAAPHGYVVGQLLQFKGSVTTGLNINHRVTEVPSTNSLKIYLKDDAFSTYPEASAETGLQTKVAPFNWEKVYESPTQRSYRSRATDSSKIVITFKRPTFHATQLVTTNAVCYEIDISKNVDVTTGSSIDSCFATKKASSGHNCFYFISSTNSDSLATAATWTNDTARVPWTLVGDERFVFLMYSSFVDGSYENGSYRQFLPPSQYVGSYRHPCMYAFGDIVSYDSQEYVTGSSFFFKFYYFENNSSYEGNIINQLYRVFLKPGSWSNYTYYYSAFDPKGTYASARTITIGPTYYSTGDGANCGYSNYVAYPQRVTGGLNYHDFQAYESNTTGVNNAGMFYKGIFPYVKYSDCNLRNIGVIRDLHNLILDTDQPFKKLFLADGSNDSWTNPNYYGNFLFELD